MNNIEKFKAVCEQFIDTYTRKNTDYGNSFSKSLEEFGDIAYVVRVSDKIERMKQLIKHDAQVKDESLIDTVKDNAIYSIMWLMERGLINE